MLYSRPCEYAIRATTYLARQAQSRLVPVGEIARAEGIPVPFLSRILYQLARAGVLYSRKGPGGGFQLARPARETVLREVVAAIDGLDGLQRCVLGLNQCSDDAPCPLHEMWKGVRGRMTAYLDRVSLADLARAAERRADLVVQET
ncbi:MAG TPA: Rrf2 family transcriptional regulator [Candidatus Acidoferrales bacterium]